jgi:hypothetical protein
VTKGAQERVQRRFDANELVELLDRGLDVGAARLPAFQDVVSDSSDHRSPLVGGESVEQLRPAVAASPIRCQCS